MRSLLLSYKHRLSNNYLQKQLDAYSTVVLLFIFVAILSFSVSNYVTKRLAIEFNPDAIDVLSSDELDSGANLAEVTVRRGDTLGKIFAAQKISRQDTHEIVKQLKQHNIEFSLKPGQVITFDYSIAAEDYDKDSLNDYLLSEINIAVDAVRNIVISKSHGNFVVKDVKAQLKKMYVRHHVKINNSFIGALSKLGISAANIQELVNAYSYQVDFQRQIKTGDSLSIVTEKFFTEDGDFAHSGKVIYSSLNLSGNNHNIYWYQDAKSGIAQYFSESGKSVKRSLLRTPVNVARISSNFGKRNHPTLGYTKMHKGVDFAAPVGTPILAAGDGVVKEMGYKGAYGNIIKVKHSANLTTAYAHASRFANLRVGSKIKQGQIIAYVGRTGRATGPHLHFEVLINGKHVNPMSVQTTPGIELKNDALRLFENYKKRIVSNMKNLDEDKPTDVTSLGFQLEKARS